MAGGPGLTYLQDVHNSETQNSEATEILSLCLYTLGAPRQSVFLGVKVCMQASLWSWDFLDKELNVLRQCTLVSKARVNEN